MQVRSTRHRRNRSGLDPSNVPTGTDATATASVVATKFQIDFNLPVVVNGLPTGIIVNGVAPTGYVVNSPTRITLDYLANVVVTQPWVIPNKCPQIRTSTGGYVAAATGTF